MFAKICLILFCATTKLSVLCAPTFTSWPQGVSSYRGGSAVLKWTLSEAVSADWYSVVLIYSKPTAELICTFLNNNLYYGKGYGGGKAVVDIKAGSPDISLTLKDIQPDNVVYHYNCTIYTTATSSVSNTQGWMLLYGPPADPEISNSPTDIIENRVLTMTCSARSTTALPADVPNDQRPIMIYTWQRDSRDLTDDGRHRVGGVANNTLTIDRVQKEDHQTTYTCIAQETGSELRNSKHIQLDVKYGPNDINIVPSDGVTKVENDTLTLTCAATCNPQCKYTWTKDGRQIGNSDKLQLASIRRQDQGTYKCRASNGIGSELEKVVSIQVYYPPKLTITVPPGGELVQGSEVTLVCSVDSRPSASSITWSNITEAGLTVLDSSQHNDTHSWLTLSDVDILDSGTYQCTADNDVRGSPVSVSKIITVEGPARWFKTEPLDLVNGVSIGDTAYFKVWIIARPLPTPSQWHWKFSANNSSNTVNTDPGQVSLNVSGNLAVLIISNVTINHYGDYFIWTRNKHGGWYDGNLTFRLVAQGRPSKPDFFHIIDVAAVGIKVQWTTGFNGGLSQTFTIRYTNVLSGALFEKSGLEDTGLGSGQNITKYITDGIEPQTKYQLQIFAVNAKGETAGDVLTTITPALAKFLQDPDIKIDGVKAQIHFIISGPLTHIQVENCVQGTDKCRSENVTVPQETRRKRQTAEVLYDFKSHVTLADPEAKNFVFLFLIYDHEFQLASKEIRLNLDKLNTPGIIIGVLLFVIFLVGSILIFIWRKGLLKRNQTRNHHNLLNSSTEGNGPGYHINEGLTCEDEVMNTTESIGKEANVNVLRTVSSNVLNLKETTAGSSSSVAQTGALYAFVNKKKKTPKNGNRVETKNNNISRKKKKEREYENIALQSTNDEDDSKAWKDYRRKYEETTYVNVIDTGLKDGAYSEVQITQIDHQVSHSIEKNGFDSTRMFNNKEIIPPFQLISDEGIVYAHLDIINKPPCDPEKIHGIENRVQYASIDYSQLTNTK